MSVDLKNNGSYLSLSTCTHDFVLEIGVGMFHEQIKNFHTKI